MRWGWHPPRGGLAPGCAIGALLAAGCGNPSGAHNAGIVWGSYGPNGGLIKGSNVDGSDRRTVVTDYGDSEGDPAWSRDGHTLAFYARNSDSVEIHVLWPRTGAHRVLRSDWRSPSEPKRTFAYLLAPTWAPAGDRLAVSDSWNGPASANATIRIVALSTGRWTSLTRPSPHLTDTEPAWSPDGRTIAFVRQRDQGKPIIFLLGRNPRDLRRLTPGRSPSWSPDGRALALTSREGVYRIDADGHGRTRIVRVDALTVSWSPDGRKLLYTTRDGQGSDAWIVNRDGTSRERVLRREFIDGIAWQPG